MCPKDHAGCFVKNKLEECKNRSRETRQETLMKVQARNSGGLHKGGVRRDKNIWMDSDYIVELQIPGFVLG